MAVRRISSELKKLRSDPLTFAEFEENGDLFHWSCAILGPESSPYEGGCFPVSIHFPANYPFAAPKLKFTCNIFHPQFADGIFCTDVLYDGWSPSLTIRDVLLRIWTDLKSPNSEAHALSSTASLLLRRDRSLYDATARWWTYRFANGPKCAQPPPPPPLSSAAAAPPPATAAAASAAAAAVVVEERGCALKAALAAGEFQAVQEYLDSGGSVNASMDSEHNTLLHFAAAANVPRLIARLCEAGAAVDAKNKLGNCPLHVAAGTEGGEESVTALVAAGSDVNRIAFRHSPLGLAVNRGSLPMASALIQAGADANLTDILPDSSSPLATAVSSRCSRMVSLLLAAGADPSLQQSEAICRAVGSPPLMDLLLAAPRSQPIASAAVWAAVRAGNAPFVARLLAAGADPDTAVEEDMEAVSAKRPPPSTPLQAAIARADVACVTALLTGGANPNYHDSDTASPLHSAVGCGCSAVVTALLSAGADTKAVSWYRQERPLHWAARDGHTEAVKALLAGGADATATNQAGETALDLARSNSHAEAVSVLEAASPSSTAGSVEL